MKKRILSSRFLTITALILTCTLFQVFSGIVLVQQLDATSNNSSYPWEELVSNKEEDTIKDELVPNKQEDTINIDSLLWSRNWHQYVTCETVPRSYYTLENATWTPEYKQPGALMRSWFSDCGGTLWVRLQSARQDGGDITTFINHTLPHLTRPFYFITTDGDTLVPSEVPLADILLESPLLLAWYTQNYDGTVHEKLHPIPIGLDLHSPYFGWWSNVSAADNLVHMKLLRQRGSTSNRSKSVLIAYMSSSHMERLKALRESKCVHPTYSHRILPVDKLWETYTQYRFGLSPRGWGLDTHRTWEMLFFGMIPIVKSSSLDPLFEKLPVLVVKEWKDMCKPGFLENRYEELKGLMPVKDEVFTMKYYLDRVGYDETYLQ